MATQLVDAVTWRPDGDADPLAPDGALARFVARARRLPTISRSYAFHGVPAGIPPDPRLLDLLRPLQGKFAVVNPVLVVPLPQPAVARATRLVRAAARRVARGGGALTVALLEEASVSMRRDSAAAAAHPMLEGPFAGTLRYRLLVAPGGIEAAAAALAPARRLSRPMPWFAISLLTPDAEALRIMDAGTQHYYRHVTGRLGGDSRDRYWLAEAWERYHEPGRIAGHIHPADVSHPLPERPPAHDAPAADPSFEDAYLYGAGSVSGERSAFGEYTPSWERRTLIPPGYCLVRFVCHVELAVADGPGRLAA